MPELRRNPLSGTWVVVSPERELRPTEFTTQTTVRASVCPFCPGNEAMTPPSLATVRGPQGGWAARVVPNKFPALRVEERADGAPVGAYDQLGGVGAHEVVIETPSHEELRGEARTASLRAAFELAAVRMRDLARDPRLVFVSYFRNRGALAGATLDHPHSQLIALPLVPGDVEGELKRAEEHQRRTGRALLHDLVHEEVRGEERVVSRSAGAIAFCPFASRVGFEVWVVPLHGGARFEQADPAAREATAVALGNVLDRLDQALPGAPFHLVLHNAPLRGEVPGWRWHFRLLPAVGRPGGLEMGTGVHINPTSPERAAAFLRQVVSQAP
jgi:UDPglucose--hexose-1-phosphate uridylyltransferase